MNLDIENAVISDYSSLEPHTIGIVNLDGVSDQEETEWQNDKWYIYWSYFNTIPKLKNAILMKAIWNVGKGYEADQRTMSILDEINGWGKDTFKDIIFNMEVIRRVGGDAFAEIIRDPDTAALLNLKPLDPGTIKIIVNRQGRIIRYEQTNKVKNNIKKFEPDQIFHLSNNRLADQIHGISDIESLEKQILADDKLFDNIDQIVKNQARPFIIFKMKTDNRTKITTFANKIRELRSLGEDVFVPDDENLLSWEVVQVNPSEIILNWRSELRNEFYRAIGLPQIVPGGGGQSTESEAKVIYLAFEQLVEHDQMFLEYQIRKQLALTINFIHPASLRKDLEQDAQKDANQGLDVGGQA